MTPEERAAKIKYAEHEYPRPHGYDPECGACVEIANTIRAAVVKEREECAILSERFRDDELGPTYAIHDRARIHKEIAAAIRERGKEEK